MELLKILFFGCDIDLLRMSLSGKSETLSIDLDVGMRQLKLDDEEGLGDHRFFEFECDE